LPYILDLEYYKPQNIICILINIYNIISLIIKGDSTESPIIICDECDEIHNPTRICQILISPIKRVKNIVYYLCPNNQQPLTELLEFSIIWFVIEIANAEK